MPSSIVSRATDPSVASILEPLNDAQRDAVTHGDGPLLIVAGAGTGKTQVLTRRIAHLIATRRARPEQILALTFTDKAAAEMESRVDQLVPLGMVGATLSTFHAFCDRLVREHAVELGLTLQLRVEQPAEIQVFLREHLFELGLERYLPLGEPDRHLAALMHVFDRARDEDVSPAAYTAFAARLTAEAGNDPVLRDRAQAETEKARAYTNYQRLMLQHGRLDFGSQISLALRVLRERPYLRREYQERYRYLLVDEFQDTNHVQFELVRMLAGERRNLTVVGDDDQSIYRFRGAKVENLLGFIDAYPGSRVLLLRHNYRSGQRILDRAHRMIQHNNPERLEARDAQRFDKRLLAARGLEGAVEHRVFATASDEADAVAAEIAAALEDATRPASDFAVVARGHRQLEPVALALRARGVRFQRGSTRGLYGRTEVMLCLNFMRLLADPDHGAAGFGVLSHSHFGVEAVDLARLMTAAQRRHVSLLQVAEAAARDASLAPVSREAIRRFLDLYRTLAHTATHRPSTEVLYAFVTESGLLGQLSAENSPEAAEAVQNLNKLFRIVQRIGPLLRSDRVPFFIRHLDLLIEAGDDPQAAVLDVDDDAVQLLTAHNAKGLEFPVVFMVQLVEGRFPLALRRDALPFPPELTHGTNDPRADHEREERRLFYVGMTRARDRLVLCHAADYGGKRARKAGRFVLEALELLNAPAADAAATALETIARFAPAAEAPPAAERVLRDDEILELSHGQIDDYLTCPLKYRYAHVVQVPLATDPRVMYGIAMHHAIRVFLQHRMRALPIDADDVVAAFDGAWNPEGFQSREHEALRHAQGQAALRAFVAREQQSRTLPLAIEMDFRFRIGNNLVKGRWDRVDEVAGGVVLTDYKTSEIESADQARERARDSLRDEQLGLYALAYTETRGVMPKQVRLSFVGAGIVGDADVDARHLERARVRIETAASGIRASAFPPRPSPRNCGYCPFSRFCIHSAARGTT